MSNYEAFDEETAINFQTNDKIVFDTKKDLITYEAVGHDQLFLSIKKYKAYNDVPYICINIKKAHKNLLLLELKNSVAPDININLTKAEINCINLMIKGKTSKLAYMVGKYHAHFLLDLY
ncbi:hypothetical protein [Francisella adeliensis]|uniref:Uncharacterized protein n=1 Tax=Francisella adeliensis TaxID=2007306 RepID=A0A2Z4Y000_9GAMM|nr:hypothetical protein [Francisella adeliensis]AXA34370.1 hypothetical protein CDH04_08160 [Francisella adeliensis]MBK2086457.1 hypothetical protein [Francisella adeliensis]MBK2096085.1 hypothetical protein [Francisella adeliensis]QIW12617.1 hypothetical protein FZC43_08165 [Francisella adeliensis]QIW14490.1 hypothetical protein FZC44_08160 [Francisella adeliensis]